MSPSILPRGSDGFEIVDVGLTGAGARSLWLSVVSRLGAVHGIRRSLTHRGSEADFEEHAERFRHYVATARREPQFAETTGRALTDVVFGDPDVLALFQRTRGAAADAGRKVLLRLMLAPNAVAELPWELLVDPEHGPHTFLTLSRDVHVVRQARVRTSPVRVEPVAPPLRMLLILSSPLDGDAGRAGVAFDLYEGKRSILNELEGISRRGLLQIDVEDRPTIATLRSAISRRRRGYHIIHFIGHGVPTGLWLENRQGRATQTSADEFDSLLRACPELRVVFFGACKSAQSPEGEPLSDFDAPSLADRCVRDSSPVVVGMRAVLPFPTERLFTRFFYQSLAGGRTIVEAVTLARAATYSDEDVGRGLLDWAVPSLTIAGDNPGAILDPSASAVPIVQQRREELMFDFVESEREFFARYVPLRQTVDFLNGQARVLWVLGPPLVGKTRLIARALEDVGERLEYVLYLTATRLRESTDLVGTIANGILELLRRRPGCPSFDESLASDDLWERLVEEMVHCPIAIVIEDVDTIRDTSQRERLLKALVRLVSRRARARLVLSAETMCLDFGDELNDSNAVRQIRLQRLGWDDVWLWIRRNKPILTRFDGPQLQYHFNKLGPVLENWRNLADELDRRAGPEGLNDELLREVVQSIQPARSPAPTDGRRSTGIRVAIVGPFTEGRQPEFAAALTTLAAQYGVAGRIVSGSGDDADAPIATLLSIPSPFAANDTARDSDILAWLERTLEERADIVLLDIAAPQRDSAIYSHVLRAVLDSGTLIVGCMAKDLSFPADIAEVLAVGFLDEDEKVVSPYSDWHPTTGKPEIFAPWRLTGSVLERVLKDPTTHGGVAAALHVVAAAVLVWAVDETQTPSDVRNVLERTARRLPGYDAQTGGPKVLDVDAAIREVKLKRLREAETPPEVSLQELSAASGFSPDETLELATRMVETGELKQSPAGSTSMFERVRPRRFACNGPIRHFFPPPSVMESDACPRCAAAGNHTSTVHAL